MSDESLMLAREVVIRYHAHGFRTKIEEDALFVRREDGWEGPLDVAAVAALQAAEIARIEDDARLATVTALARELERLRRRGLSVRPYHHFGFNFEGRSIQAGSLRLFLARAGWSEARVELYAGVAESMHERGELLRESLD